MPSEYIAKYIGETKGATLRALVKLKRDGKVKHLKGFIVPGLDTMEDAENKILTKYRIIRSKNNNQLSLNF